MKISPKRIRLAAGWALLPPYLILARPSPLLIAAGATLSFAGVLLRAWAAGTIRKNAALAIGGPYAYTRNPLYLGSFLIGLGLAVAGGRIIVLAAFIVLFTIIYGRAMRAEAGRMEQLFNHEYERYARNVPLFIPRIRPYRAGYGNTPGRFRLEHYLRNREYQAALGVLLGFLALVIRITWW